MRQDLIHRNDPAVVKTLEISKMVAITTWHAVRSTSIAIWRVTKLVCRVSAVPVWHGILRTGRVCAWLLFWPLGLLLSHNHGANKRNKALTDAIRSTNERREI